MTAQTGGAWDQLVDELKVFPKEEDIHDQMMDPMVSPPLVRSTSTHQEEQARIENKMFFHDQSSDHSENKQITANIANRSSIQSQKSIFRVSKGRPQSSRSSRPTKTRTRSSSFQRSIDSNSDENSLSTSYSRRRSGSFDMKNYARRTPKYKYNPCKPGFAFGTAQRRLHGKSNSIPAPGAYMPKVGIGHDATTRTKFHSKSKRFAHNYRIGSTPASMGPGMYNLPSSFKTHSFNSKAGRGGTFSRSKRMEYKVDKNIPNAARYYPKVENYAKKGSAVSKARRFAAPEITEQKNKVPVGNYNVLHIVNHDRQTAYYPVSNRKLASKIGKK